MISPTFRRLLVFILLIVLGGVGYAAYANYAKPVSKPGYGTDWTFTDIDGNGRSLSDFRGKVLILEFSTTTCESCVVLHTKGYLHEFYEKYKDKVEIIYISIAGKKIDTPERMRAYRGHFKIDWPMTWDEGQKLMIEMKVPSLFTHIWLDKAGGPRYYNSGAIEAVKEEYPKILELFEKEDWQTLKEFQGKPIIEVG